MKKRPTLTVTETEDHLLKLAGMANMRNQLEPFIRNGKWELVKEKVMDEGCALAIEFNHKRKKYQEPLAFYSLVSKSGKDESRKWMQALQQLFLSITDVARGLDIQNEY